MERRNHPPSNLAHLKEETRSPGHCPVTEASILPGMGMDQGHPKSDDQLIVWQKEEAPAARPELPPSQLGGFAMRQAVIGLGRLTARRL